ncbi:MAG: hypothetical protein CL578_05600 [Alteromonadaceae bacterium]|uniref:Uncharacterized protein n=1 Tax=Paraglaciecola agarilytica NO2 TaxID=1125747 RepID=A0ABQ0I1X0_9ALTE|nr:hypothetical protein [Paraglaciecola agarilytica]MBN24507.1 hypothetical protein [Alteromonadaceae bacterium]GAC03310.1 hypothetical protein GAGA_0445 [Paraglaciecola agarilytica NO2]|tara:strand:+ start:45057 stop:45620 length:564 start_codon:yes stop_codon:yes gene_type:complete
MKSYSRFNVPFDLEVDFELRLYEYTSNLKPEAARRVLVQGAAFKKFLASSGLVIGGCDLNKEAVDGAELGHITVRISTDDSQSHGSAQRVLNEIVGRPKSHIRTSYLRILLLHGFYLECVNNGQKAVVVGVQGHRHAPQIIEPIRKEKKVDDTQESGTIHENQQLPSNDNAKRVSSKFKLKGLVNNV